MEFRAVLLLFSFCVGVFGSERPRYTICVNNINFGYLRRRNTSWYRNETAFELIVKRDQLECMRTVASGGADCMLTAGVADLWIAARTPAFRRLKMFAEMVTDDRNLKTPEYVAVVDRRVAIGSLADLKGLRSCHDGSAYDHTFQTHYMRLVELGALVPADDPTLSAKENQLRALATFFSSACVPGRWSHVPHVDRRLKSTYPNLKVLCENISTVDYEERHYVDLKCLTRNGGQIAWSTHEKVKSFFGLNANATAHADSKKYMYLCPDASRRPLRLREQCTWAKEPWNGLLADPHRIGSMHDLQKQSVRALNALLLEMSEAPFRVDLIDPIEPSEILAANNMSVVDDSRTVNFCVLSPNESAKCESFATTSFYLNFRPRFVCVLRRSTDECLEFLGARGGIVAIDPFLLDVAENAHRLKPVMAERYGTQDGQLDTVAVVRRNRGIESWDDLRGGRACLTEYGTTTGYVAPVHMVSEVVGSNRSCVGVNTLIDFFSGGVCMPGSAPTNESERLCSQCVGDVDGRREKLKTEHVCAANSSEAFYGDVGVLRCLVEGQGDVAFVKRLYTLILAGNRPKLEWAKSSRLSDYEILCPDGSRVPIEENLKSPARCSIIPEPPNMIVTRIDEPPLVIEEIQDVLAEVSNYFNHFVIYVNLFGSYGDDHNLLFRGFTKQLVPAAQYADVLKEYERIVRKFRSC